MADATHKLNQYIWGRWRIRLKADQQPDVMAPSEASPVYRDPTAQPYCIAHEWLPVFYLKLAQSMES